MLFRSHKHVPLMEDVPCEAVHNNVFGTLNVLQAVKKYAVPKFVLISSDKAVNPTNVMGATKRYCELLCRAMACEPGCVTDYVAVRFGNVLGSNGSVLKLFQMQLEHGGPLLVTDKRVVRYFMTIPEAAGLVIKAASIACRSETYVLDMGEPVKILELAENYIRLSGYKPYTEIPIIETGLRPGEKLFEELLLNDNKHESTAASRIFVEKDLEHVDIRKIKRELLQFQAAIDKCDDVEMLKLLHRFIPSFRTPEEFNSKFEIIPTFAEEKVSKRRQEICHSGIGNVAGMQ